MERKRGGEQRRNKYGVFEKSISCLDFQFLALRIFDAIFFLDFDSSSKSKYMEGKVKIFFVFLIPPCSFLNLLLPSYFHVCVCDLERMGC